MTPRTYRSTVREQTAAATREAILDAAEELFEEHGYARVTIKRIAEEAAVAQGTVYAVFGSKPALVTALTERAAGDASIDAVLAAIEAAGTGEEVVGLLVENTSEIVRRHGRTMGVLFEAASMEEGIASALREAEILQRARFARVIAHLEHLGALRRGVTQDGAVRVLEFLVTPPSWHRMRQLGWDWEDAGVFLAEQVGSALLRRAGD